MQIVQNKKKLIWAMTASVARVTTISATQAASADQLDNSWSANSVDQVKSQMQQQGKSQNLDGYLIKWGDTVNALSQASGMSVDDIVNTYGITDKNLIYAGDSLQRKGNTSSSPTTATGATNSRTNSQSNTGTLPADVTSKNSVNLQQGNDTVDLNKNQGTMPQDAQVNPSFNAKTVADNKLATLAGASTDMELINKVASNSDVQTLLTKAHDGQDTAAAMQAAANNADVQALAKASTGGDTTKLLSSLVTAAKAK